MLSIITPCSRPQNLQKLKESIEFQSVRIWYIVYDTSKTPLVKQFEDNSQIVELGVDQCSYGGPQRNCALELVPDSDLIYFLDDDNIVHSAFWTLFPKFDLDHIYTFDLEKHSKKGTSILKGGNPKKLHIDTAQFVIPKKLLGTSRWRHGKMGDGHLMEEMHSKHKDKFVYINTIASYWNKINPK